MELWKSSTFLQKISIKFRKESNTKISILCPKHGEFKQKPIKHIIGQGCPICAQELCYSETRLFEELKKLLPQ